MLLNTLKLIKEIKELNPNCSPCGSSQHHISVCGNTPLALQDIKHNYESRQSDPMLQA